MPYISQKDRTELDKHLKELLNILKSTHPNELAGRLNYCFSILAVGLFIKEQNYNRANLINGVFVSAQQEFSRRQLSSYEDKKIEINGDLEV